MDQDKMHIQFVLERCELYLAQMRATHHLGLSCASDKYKKSCAYEVLLKNLGRDLGYLKETIDKP